MRRVLRSTALATGLVALAAAAWVSVAGPIELTLLHIPIRSHDPWRSVLIAIAALVVFVAAGGRAASAWSILKSVDRVDDRWIAATLAIAVCVTGIVFGTTVAGGADSYGYVSEADLWISGHLKQSQTWAQQAPWPTARWSFTPLGYRPGNTDEDAWSIVPVYSPGLPLLMAGAKIVGGQEGMFWVVPIFGGLLVLGTFGIGRRLGASRAGLIGAFLLATSPAVLFMVVAPMTDVAVAGAWTVAFYLLLGDSRASALGAGLAAGAAALIRPNNAFEVGVLGLWYLLLAWRTRAWRREIGRAALFALGAAPAIASIVAINAYLYGSPLQSGYGSLSEQFNAANIAINAKRYFSWFVFAHTPVALLGLLPLAVPLRWFWPSVKHRVVFVVIGLFVALLLVEFFAYLVFDVWWYLRFVIPCLPFILIGVGAIVAAATRGRPVVVALGATALILALGARDLEVAKTESAFALWQGDRRYVVAARLTNRLTEPASVIYCMQHSGSMRYYGGRLTVRYDLIDDGWLDRSVEWFQSRGAHPYLLLEEWEIDRFKQQFPGAERLAVLKNPPMFVYEGGAKIALYDLAAAPDASAGTLNVVDTYADPIRSAPPVPAPIVSFAR